MDLDYYFNIFQPQYVVFEVAEYTFIETYFRTADMAAMDLNPALPAVRDAVEETQQGSALPYSITAQRGQALTTLTWRTEATGLNVWLLAEYTYDMQPVESGYEVTIPTEVYDNWKDRLQLCAYDGTTLITLTVP